MRAAVGVNVLAVGAHSEMHRVVLVLVLSARRAARRPADARADAHLVDAGQRGRGGRVRTRLLGLGHVMYAVPVRIGVRALPLLVGVLALHVLEDARAARLRVGAQQPLDLLALRVVGRQGARRQVVLLVFLVLVLLVRAERARLVLRVQNVVLVVHRVMAEVRVLGARGVHVTEQVVLL